MNINNIQQLIDIIGKFKDLKRSGWIDKNVLIPESDADHSFSVALLAMLLMPEDLDEEKCLKMALIHDLAEVYIGDYTPYDSITEEDKQVKEFAAMDKISGELAVSDWRDIFKEYVNKSSKEAIFINAIDKLDNVITAAYYDKNNRAPTKVKKEFADYTIKKINELPDIKSLQNIKEILKQIV